MSKKEILNKLAEVTMHILEEEYWTEELSPEDWEEQHEYINEVAHELMDVLVKKSIEEKV